MTDTELLATIKALGEYIEVRLLEDRSIIAIGNLMFTRAIYMDVDMHGWDKRFCYSDVALADQEFQRLSNGNQEPTGWIARR